MTELKEGGMLDREYRADRGEKICFLRGAVVILVENYIYLAVAENLALHE